MTDCELILRVFLSSIQTANIDCGKLSLALRQVYIVNSFSFYSKSKWKFLDGACVLHCFQVRGHSPKHFVDIEATANLKTQLGAAPVSALGVPLDGVIGSQTNPVWQRTVLPLLLGKRTLCSESLLGRLLVDSKNQERRKGVVRKCFEG